MVLHSKNWIPGIIGLVAGRVVEEYGVSVIAISEGEKLSKGSARSANGLNIVEAIRQCQHLLIDVGGHPGAAGFSLETAKISEFKETLYQVVEKEELLLETVLEIDSQVPVKRLNMDLAKRVNEFEPFGIGNPEPLLASLNTIPTEVKTVGAGKHLKFKVAGIDCIAFGLGKMASLISPNQPINLAYNLGIDSFNGSEKLQLKIRDIQLD